MHTSALSARCCPRASFTAVRAARLLAAVVLALLAALPLGAAAAQAVPQRAFADLRWRLVGPFRAGRVLAVAGVPGDPATFYFGSVAGGVWKTTNAGRTWEPLFDDQPIASVGALAVAPSNPSVIYVGTGEPDMRSDITYGNGVYKSVDAGKTWTHVGLADTRQIGRVLVDPRDPNVVLVAALGHAYGPNAERGVFKSTDGGQTWRKVLFRDDSTGAIDLASDPTAPDVIYAALWQVRRPPWSQYPPDEGPGSGLFMSTDGGDRWTPIVGRGLPAGPLGRAGLAVAGGSGGKRVYALLGEARGGAAGLYRSDDGGASWRRTSTDPNITTRGWYFGRVMVDPKQPDVVYVPNRGVVRSTDGGATFTTIKGSPGGDDYHFLWIDPEDGRRMIVGSDQGTVVSLDGGATWSSWYNQPTAQFYHVITDRRWPYYIYGAQQDAGSVAIASRSDIGEITVRDWFPPGAGEAGYVAPDPLDSNIVYGGDTYGVVHRFDRRTGQIQDVSPSPLSAFGTPMPARALRFTWTSPLVFDPLDPHTLYLGAQHVLRTRDGGLHWERASPDLTRATPGAAAERGALTLASAAAQGWGVVYTIAPSPVREGVLWAGTDDGRIHHSADGGAHWEDVTPPGLAPWSKVSLIDASALDANTAYAAVDRHRLDDIAPYAYRTHDAGKHWTRIDRGIPTGAYVRAVRADPVRAGLLYAGTELGVFVSFDDGDHWQPLQLNLPVSPVHDLVVHDTDLVIATHGRSFWVLDDIAPLRQLADSIVRAPLHLFRPSTAVRVRRSVNNDTPLPPETPAGENPPAGAVIDYWLGAAPRGPVVLEIVDSSGAVVRRITSDSGVRPPAPSQPPYFMDAWLPRAEPLPATAGHHRFVWDLRYERPPAASYDYSIAAVIGQGTVAEPQGPLVLPGTYTVRLMADGQTATQPLRVRMDPRVTVGSSVLTEQLALALDIWRAMADADALRRETGGVHEALGALDRRRLDAGSAREVDALGRAIDSLRIATIQDDLGQLAVVVGGADRQPSVQASEAFRAERDRLAAARARWDALRSGTLPALNARLTRRGVAAVAPMRVEPARPTAGAP